jgi:YebC/PmpR family DNA-binding regulatory protein
MSGHSKWAQIKRQKGVTDARRGQLFTKLTREIMVAVRQGGTNPETNFQLRLAIQKARSSNMPLENIERAINRASGGGEASELITAILEGYGPNGVAVLVEVLTDNRKRAIQEVRRLFTRHNSNLGESGCVSWLFENKGVIMVESDGSEAEEVALRAIDAGAEDVKTEKGYLEIHTQPQDMEKVKEAIGEGRHIISTELSLVPKTTVMLGEKEATQTLAFLDQLEELDDVQRVSSNIDFSDTTLEGLRSQAGA